MNKSNIVMTLESSFMVNWFKVNNYNVERYSDLIMEFILDCKLSDIARDEKLMHKYIVKENSIRFETMDIVNLEQLKEYFVNNELRLFDTEDVTFSMDDDIAPKTIVDYKNAFTVSILDGLFAEMEHKSYGLNKTI